MHIADLLERFVFRRPRGGAGQRTPSYDRSSRDKTLLLAIQRVRSLVEEGLQRVEAIEEIASEFKISPSTLANAYSGKRGALRRVQARSRVREAE